MRLRFVIVLSILCLIARADAIAQEADGVAIYNRLLKSAVLLKMMPNPEGRGGNGTGWIIDKPRKLVMTNHHVGAGQEEMDAFFPVREGDQVVAERDRYDREFKPTRARLIHSDPSRDLCLFEVDALPPDAEAIPLAEKSASPGTLVHCIGNPGGSGAYWVYNTGTVRQVAQRRLNLGTFVMNCRVLETQNPTNPGDSGGPVVNAKYELIGVTNGGIPGIDLMNTSVDVSEVKAFMKAVDSFVEPRLVDDFKRRGMAYKDAGRNQKALADFARVLELNPEEGEGHLGRAICLSRLEQHEPALAAFATAAKLRPEDPAVFRERGIAWIRRKDPAKAAEDWTEAIRLNPKDIESLEHRAQLFEAAKLYDKALTDWTALVALLPESADPRFNRGRVYWKSDANAKAVEDFTEALKLFPHPNILYHRGLAYMDLKQYEQALKDMTLTIRASQRFAPAFCARGEIFRLHGKLQEAIDDLSEAVRLNPDYSIAYLRRSMAFREKGLKEMAQSDYDKAVALEPALANVKLPDRLASATQERPRQAMPSEVTAAESPDLETCMRELARDVARELVKQGHTAISVGQFTSPPQLPASTGPGLANMLADELRKFGAQVGPAEFGVKGEFRDVSDVKAGRLAVRIQADLVGREGNRVARFARLVRGASNVAPLLGLSVVLPSDRPEREREKRLQESVDHPQTKIEGTRVAAAAGSPYLVEILVQEPGGLKPRTPKLDDGLAFVDIEKGETYAIRVVNNSDYDAAVTLAIDGLNLFAFSQNREYSYFILAAKSETIIKGWHRTNTVSDSFLITEYAKSAAAELEAGTASMGTITASFAAAWPADQPPPADELAGRLGNRGEGKATGRGPVVALNYQEVRRQVGAVRSVVSVRYDKP